MRVDRVGRAISIGLAVVLFLAPLAIGAVHAGTSAVLEICVWLLALGWFLASKRSSAPLGFVGAGAALSLYLALQLVPISRSALSWLSPVAEGIYAAFPRGTEKSQEREGAAAARSSGEPRDEAAGLIDVEHVRRLAINVGDQSSRPIPAIAVDPLRARSDLLRYLAYGFVLWIAATLPAPGFLLKSAVVSGTAISALALIEFFTWNGHILWFFDPYDTGPLGDYPRMIGSFVNPDHLAAFLAMILAPGAAWLALRAKQEVRRRASSSRWIRVVLIAIGLALIVAALVGSASRAGIVGALFGTALFAWGSKIGRAAEALQGTGKRPPRPVRNRWAAVAAHLRRFVPLGAAVTIILAGFLYAGQRARGLLDLRLGEMFFGSDFEGRMVYWRQSLPILGDFPLFGVGMGGWHEVFRQYVCYPLTGLDFNHAHNDYLEWCTEVGFVGAALTMVLLWAYVSWARKNENIPSTLRWGLVGGIAAIGWHEIVDFSLRIPANALLLSVLLGLLCNEGWSEKKRATLPDGVGGENSARRGGILTGGCALATALLLTVASLRQFREFRQWLDVRNGSTELRFAPANADTWLQLGKLLYKKGLRYDPVTADCFLAAALRRPAAAEAYWGLSLTATTFAEKLRYLEATLYVSARRAPCSRV